MVHFPHHLPIIYIKAVNKINTLIPFSDRLGEAYRAIAIPQNVMLTIPDMFKP